MEIHDENPTAQRLVRAFMQFNRMDWHDRTIEGCKPSEIKVLFCIRRGIKPDSPFIKVSEISKILRVTSPTVTQLLKGLEANGLIERHMDQADRRAVDVQLTEKGLMVTQRAASAFFQSFQGLMEYLGEEESSKLADLLFKVFQYFQEKETSVSGTRWSGDEDA